MDGFISDSYLKDCAEKSTSAVIRMMAKELLDQRSENASLREQVARLEKDIEIAKAQVRLAEAMRGEEVARLERERGGLVRSEFIECMEAELTANSRKGDWTQWHPTVREGMGELNHHVDKLYRALDGMNLRAVTEHCADVANIAMKIEEHYGDAALRNHSETPNSSSAHQSTSQGEEGGR